VWKESKKNKLEKKQKVQNRLASSGQNNFQ
jgi:hypothetical protein